MKAYAEGFAKFMEYTYQCIKGADIHPIFAGKYIQSTCSKGIFSLEVYDDDQCTFRSDEFINVPIKDGKD